MIIYWATIYNPYQNNQQISIWNYTVAAGSISVVSGTARVVSSGGIRGIKVL